MAGQLAVVRTLGCLRKIERFLLLVPLDWLAGTIAAEAPVQVEGCKRPTGSVEQDR
jgi:hypothetical protein